ncbi:MAG TPA: hypothetical protein VF821_09235, partial [Lentzea sp.]
TYTSVIASVREANTGVASATCGISRALGAALGVQIAAALLTASPSDGTFRLGFLLAAVVVLLPLALVGGVPGWPAVTVAAAAGAGPAARIRSTSAAPSTTDTTAAS